MKVNNWKRTDSLFVGQAASVARDHENYLWNNTWHDLHARRPFKTNIKLLKQRTWIVFTRIQRVKIRYSCPFVMYTNFISVLNYDTLKYKQIKGRELYILREILIIFSSLCFISLRIRIIKMSVCQGMKFFYEFLDKGIACYYLNISEIK